MQQVVVAEALNKQRVRPLPDYNTTWPQPGCKAGPGPWGSGAATAVDGAPRVTCHSLRSYLQDLHTARASQHAQGHECAHMPRAVWRCNQDLQAKPADTVGSSINPWWRADNRFTVVHAPHPFALGPDIYQDRRKLSRIYTYSYKLALFRYSMMQWNEHACFRTGSQRMRDPCKPARHAAWFLPEELHMQATKLRCGPSD